MALTNYVDGNSLTRPPLLENEERESQVSCSQSQTLQIIKQSNSDNGEEYAMAVKNIKKFFRRKGKFVRQPKNDIKSFNKKSSHDEKKDKSKDERRCFRCGYLNHFIQDCPKPPNKDNKNNAFISGAWSDSGGEHDETKEDKCLMALGINEVHSNSTYYSDELIENYDNLKMQYDGLCDLSSKVINKNRTLKTKIKELENELLEIKNFNNVLIKDSNDLKKENESLKVEMKNLQHHKQTLSTFNKSSEILDDLLKAQKPSNDKSGLGFTNDTNVASTSKTKPTTFVKAKNVEVDRNILLKAKVAQTRKFSIEKPQVIKQFCKPKQGLGNVRNNYPRQVSSKAYRILNKATMVVEESLNVSFDETPPKSKSIELIDDDVCEVEMIRSIESESPIETNPIQVSPPKELLD
ncbi:hypothetical protein L1987_23446 [Smallanthus sonchifolius]|uniref:Uncharacterized protein n=1 Tax=Smallanthus sonchifolius TaxID=185202 RepID=A0ACB9II90_9ASTR|nr:hypothetical protein L1987_23446 [Smallanthus sonchifolius]